MRLIVWKARIPKKEREVFEQFGVNAIGQVLSGGSNPRAPEIRPVYNDDTVRDHARLWMSEQHQRAERKEDWMFVMEVAITLFVAGELYFSILDHWGKWW